MKKVESSNLEPIWLKKTSVLIEKAPPGNGGLHSRMLFFPVIVPHGRQEFVERFSTADGLNPEYYKYQKEEDGFDHYYLRSIMNNVKYDYTDIYMKLMDTDLLKVKVKRREVLIESGSDVGAFYYELTLKKE